MKFNIGRLLAATGAALVMVVAFASTAQADQTLNTQQFTAEQVVTYADVAAAEYEVNVAVAGTLPPRSQLVCASVPAVEICYQPDGDHWWVQDQAADGASAAVHWENFRGGSLYRYGICVNSLGNGNWGQCNKDYYEDSVLNGFPCVWDRGSGADPVCNSSGWRFQ